MNAADSYTDYRARTETSLDAAYDNALWRVRQAVRDADACLAELLVKEHFTYSEQYHLQHMHSEIKALSAALAKIPFLKANYNPNQPRVPRGNADGGQWTSGDIVAGNNQVEYIQSVPMASGRQRNIVNIFIGGAGDSNQRIVRDSASIKKVYGDNYYTFQNSGEFIREFISRLPKDRKINLIGHSWGGDTAADLAVEFQGRVNKLVTIDPVSLRQPDFSKVKGSVHQWVNVFANDYSPSIGNLAALVGGSWGMNQRRLQIFI